MVNVFSEKTIKELKKFEKQFSSRVFNRKDELIKELGLKKITFNDKVAYELENGISGEVAIYEDGEVKIYEDEENFICVDGEDNIIAYLENDFEVTGNNETDIELFDERKDLTYKVKKLYDELNATITIRQELLMNLVENDGFDTFENKDEDFIVLYSGDNTYEVTIPINSMFDISTYEIEEL